jgi:hypothetical protein
MEPGENTEDLGDALIQQRVDDVTVSAHEAIVGAGKQTERLHHEQMLQWIALGVALVLGSLAILLNVRTTAAASRTAHHAADAAAARAIKASAAAASAHDQALQAQLRANAARIVSVEAQQKNAATIRCLTLRTRRSVAKCIGAQPGAPGRPGAAGGAGTPGPVGNPGNAGLPGLSGKTGATGAQGATGGVGATGDAGSAGSAGSNGGVGATGAQGPPGADGAVGPQGPQGDPGPQGPQGPAGADAVFPATLTCVDNGNGTFTCTP